MIELATKSHHYVCAILLQPSREQADGLLVGVEKYEEGDRQEHGDETETVQTFSERPGEPE